ncbi:organic solvent tolerance protein, partial [Candidatus Pelagibacter sp.]|nr:organic solvent tolerance protein [Candidatus Pelagibacter sp.]
IIGNNGYISNNTSFAFNDSNSLSFNTRKNKKTDLTEFYNLIYEYKNDCLRAAIKYNKEYYIDSDLKPSEQIFFTLTIMPFGETKSPYIK